MLLKSPLTNPTRKANEAKRTKMTKLFKAPKPKKILTSDNSEIRKRNHTVSTAIVALLACGVCPLSQASTQCLHSTYPLHMLIRPRHISLGIAECDRHSTPALKGIRSSDPIRPTRLANPVSLNKHSSSVNPSDPSCRLAATLSTAQTPCRTLRTRSPCGSPR